VCSPRWCGLTPGVNSSGAEFRAGLHILSMSPDPVLLTLEPGRAFSSHFERVDASSPQMCHSIRRRGRECPASLSGPREDDSTVSASS